MKAKRTPVSVGDGEAGFTLLEIVISVALFALLAGIVLQAITIGKQVLTGVAASAGTQSSAPVERFIATLREASQSSIGVSATSGIKAAGYGDVKLVMYAKDDAGKPSYTAFSQNGSSVYRLEYGAAVPGAGAPQVASVVAGITSLATATVSADALAAQYGLGRPGVSHSVPLAPAAAAAGIPVQAGNHVVAVTVSNGAVARTFHIAAGVMPSGFTISGTPVVHAVVYRIDNPPACVRVLGICVGTRTTGTIYGRVSVSYNNGASWNVWCDSMVLHPDIYVGPNGFFTHAAKDGWYDPNDPLQKTAGLVDKCRAQAAAFPDPNSTNPPQRLATPVPIVYDTPPPDGTITYCVPGSVTPTCIDPTPPPTPAPAAVLAPGPGVPSTSPGDPNPQQPQPTAPAVAPTDPSSVPAPTGAAAPTDAPAPTDPPCRSKGPHPINGPIVIDPLPCGS